MDRLTVKPLTPNGSCHSLTPKNKNRSLGAFVIENDASKGITEEGTVSANAPKRVNAYWYWFLLAGMGVAEAALLHGIAFTSNPKVENEMAVL